MGLRRSARLPVTAALHACLKRPILLVTDRADHALTLFDELTLWAPGATRYLFPEPNPLFYEKAPWGKNTRRDRLQVLTSLAAHQIPGAPSPADFPIIIAPARALMTRTLATTGFSQSLPHAAAWRPPHYQ